MNRESIEKLTIDKQAGELSDEAIQLLDEYLVQHPEAMDWSGQIADMYDKCHRAIAALTIQDTPPAKPMQLRTAGVKLFHRKAGLRAAAIFLTAVLCFYLGILSQNSHPPKSRQTITKIPTQQSQNIDQADGQVSDFWRSRAIVSMQAKTCRLKQPPRQNKNFWAKFKNNTKGKNNE